MMPTWVGQSIQHYVPEFIDFDNRERSAVLEAPIDLEASTAVETNTAVSNEEAARSHEDELVKLARQGDTRAFGELIQQNYNDS